MSYLRLLPTLAALATLLVIPDAHASGPAGVWALVDQVTLEPDDINPSQIRIDGTFIVANMQPDFPQYSGYGEPQVGYMYYSCADKLLTTCVMEWKELLAVAGTADNCRGWGDNSFPTNGVVRAPKEQPIDTDIYPISMGLFTGVTPCNALTTWQEQQGESSSSTTGESGESASTTGESGESATTTTGPSSESASVTSDTGSAGETAGGTAGGTAGETAGETAKTVSGDPETTAGDASGLATAPTEASATGTGGGESSSSGTVDLDDDKGCACDARQTPARHGLGALVMLAGLGLLGRRRP